MRAVVYSCSVSLIVMASSCTQASHSPQYKSHEGELQHIVLLDLKDDVGQDELNYVIERLNSLAEIEVVKDLTVSKRSDSPDPRAKQNYDLLLQMYFDDMDDLATYADFPDHKEVRELIKAYMFSAPVVYDTWVNSPKGH